MTQPYLLPATRPEAAAPRLQGRAVVDLDRAEQLLLWVLRRRCADGGGDSPALVAGLRLAFGLSRLEPALAAFERLYRTTAAGTFAPVAAPTVALEEERLLRAVVAARPSDAGSGLSDPAAAVARLLGQAGLTPACRPARWH